MDTRKWNSLFAPMQKIAVVSFLSFFCFVFSGFAQDVVVGDTTANNVMLHVSLQQLEEIVVVGYGQQKKENVVGSISQKNYKKRLNSFLLCNIS